MAIHAHTPPASAGERSRSLFIAPGGPVSTAITVGRGEHDPIAAIREGLDRHFVAANRQRIRELRRAIADRIEADIALLDALTPDVDLGPDVDREPDADGEPSLGALEWSERAVYWGGDTNDREAGDDNGVADEDGRREQFAGTRYAYQGAV